MPLTIQQESLVAKAKLTVQFITGALVVGVLFFALIVASLSLGKELRWDVDVLGIVGSMLGFGNVVAAVFLVPIFHAQQLKLLLPSASGVKASDPKASDWDDGLVRTLLERNQSTTIIRFALMEGAAFFNLIVFMVNQSLLPLIVTGAILLGMLAIFPRQSHFDRLFNDRT
ncbi:MAG: hypothetical protein JNL67_06755 [Planctomycetaceae bacterium]|nr:hypothetical protein [Planctomycetaceae bacterium]